MNKPNVQLKKTKTFRGMEGYGLNAEVWINGIYCMYLIDNGDGGCFNYEHQLYNNPNADQVKANVKLLEDYIKTLPEKDYGTFKAKIDMDTYLNDIWVAQEEEKLKKKRERRMSKLFQTAIVIGKPNAKEYRFMNFKQPLSTISPTKLTFYVAKLVAEECHDGVKILNTNLKFENGKVTLTL